MLPEVRIGDADRVRIFDVHRIARCKSRNSERHRETVIAEDINLLKW